MTTPLQNEHRVAERVEPVPLRDRGRIQLSNDVDSRKSHHEREQRRARQMKVREQGVDPPKLEPGHYEHGGPTTQLASAHDCLEHANAGRPDSEHAFGLLDSLPCVGLDAITLAVDRVILEPCFYDRTKCVQANVKGHAHMLEPTKEVVREMKSRRRRGRRPGLSRVHGLVSARVAERLVDVRGQRSLAGRLPLEPNDPASVPEVLDELDRTESFADTQPAGGTRKAFPELGAVEAFDEKYLHCASRRAGEPQTTWYDPRVVHDRELTPEDFRELGEHAVLDHSTRFPIDKETRRVARLGRRLSDEFRRQLVVQERGVHPTVRVASAPMDESALQRARQRISAAAEGRPHPADVGAALERSREQIEALAATAAELEAAIPAQVAHAVRDGLRAEVLPVARHIAEIRGLFNQAIRRLERVEGELLAERNARVDDLALLVDLVTSGWHSVDMRLARLEDAHSDTAASLDGLVESMLAEDDAASPLSVAAAASPDSAVSDPTTPAGPGPGFPAQGSQAEAIVERAGVEHNNADRAADRAAAAA